MVDHCYPYQRSSQVAPSKDSAKACMDSYLYFLIFIAVHFLDSENSKNTLYTSLSPRKGVEGTDIAID